MKKINFERLFDIFFQFTDEQRFFLFYLFEYTYVRIQLNSISSSSFQTSTDDFFPTLIITFEAQQITQPSRALLGSFPSGFLIDYGSENAFCYVKLDPSFYILFRLMWSDLFGGRRYNFVRFAWKGRLCDTMPNSSIHRAFCPSWAEYPAPINVFLFPSFSS